MVGWGWDGILLALGLEWGWDMCLVILVVIIIIEMWKLEMW